jgi:hypothetical protein
MPHQGCRRELSRWAEDGCQPAVTLGALACFEIVVSRSRRNPGRIHSIDAGDINAMTRTTHYFDRRLNRNVVPRPCTRPSEEIEPRALSIGARG